MKRVLRLAENKSEDSINQVNLIFCIYSTLDTEQAVMPSSIMVEYDFENEDVQIIDVRARIYFVRLNYDGIVQVEQSNNFRIIDRNDPDTLDNLYQPLEESTNTTDYSKIDQQDQINDEIEDFLND